MWQLEVDQLLATPKTPGTYSVVPTVMYPVLLKTPFPLASRAASVWRLLFILPGPRTDGWLGGRPTSDDVGRARHGQ